MARDDRDTNVIEYTWDEGLTWEVIKFSDEPIEITNIVTEPTNMEQIFLA